MSSSLSSGCNSALCPGTLSVINKQQWQMRTLPAQMGAEIVNYGTTTEWYRVDAKRDVLQACKMMYSLSCSTWSKDQGCSGPLACGMDIWHLVVVWYCTGPLQTLEGNLKWTDVSYKSHLVWMCSETVRSHCIAMSTDGSTGSHCLAHVFNKKTRRASDYICW